MALLLSLLALLVAAAPSVASAQRRQQPFFQERRTGRAPEAPARLSPTPRLQVGPDPNRPGDLQVTGPSGARYRLVPDPFAAGWYRVVDENGQTVYQLRPNSRGPGTYDVKP